MTRDIKNTGAVEHVFSSVDINIPFGKGFLRMERGGFPVSQESIKLIEFTCNHCNEFNTAVDLGTGSGFLALALSAFRPDARILGLDIQSSLVDMAQRNKQTNQPGASVDFQVADIRRIEKLPPQHSQDLVISNPPFRKTNTGKISTDIHRSRSCHELTATLRDIVRAASHILKHNGFFSLVILPERLVELFLMLHSFHLTPVFLRFIHHHPAEAANTALLISRKESRSGLYIEPPLFIEDDLHNRSESLSKRF